ncbi:DUF308 domain-containing protein [Pseudolysinimonas sp.]|uniref:DUF308 domain-containing protein n=1 Tax=Pseudolysinimonas sp. TaxID=2680009 RepID=UPI003F7F6A97
MSAAPAVVPRRPRVAPWTLTAVRAALVLVLGLAITFTGGHSAGFGLVAFGLFGLVSGAVLLAGAVLALGRAVRGPFVVQAVVTLVAGLAALVAVASAPAERDVIVLVGIVSAFGLVTGALELVTGVRARGRDRGARDWILVGALTVLLGVAFLVVPPGYRQSLGGIQNISGTLTASVVLVGLLGAWGIVVGVLQAISAVSLRGGEAEKDGGAA